MDVAGELRAFFASFAGDVPFQNPRTADHCVLHVGDLTARLAPRHYWVDAPVVLDAAVAHFRAEGFDVFDATAYSAPDHWEAKYGATAPLEPRHLLQRSLPPTPSPALTGADGTSPPPSLGSRDAAPLQRPAEVSLAAPSPARPGLGSPAGPARPDANIHPASIPPSPPPGVKGLWRSPPPPPCAADADATHSLGAMCSRL